MNDRLSLQLKISQLDSPVVFLKTFGTFMQGHHVVFGVNDCETFCAEIHGQHCRQLVLMLLLCLVMFSLTKMASFTPLPNYCSSLAKAVSQN